MHILNYQDVVICCFAVNPQPTQLKNMLRVTAFTFFSVSLLAFTGCPKPPAETDSHEHSDGEHAHHDHEVGPNGGHILEFDKEGYHAEWTHDEETHGIAVFILDESAKKDVAIAAESVTIEVMIGEDEKESFELPALKTVDGKSASFGIENEELMVHLKMTGKKESGVNATLWVDIEGQAYSATIVEEEHHHHHH